MNRLCDTRVESFYPSFVKRYANLTEVTHTAVGDYIREVQAGEFRIPFKKLIPYIKEENRFYPLPDGTYFLIPEEWLNKYKDLAKFANTKEGKVRLTKSQFTLLEEIEDQAPQIEEKVDTNFRPSPLLKAELRPYQLAGVQCVVCASSIIQVRYSLHACQNLPPLRSIA